MIFRGIVLVNQRPLSDHPALVVVFVLALAQPLLDLLGRNAEFFLARSSPPIDIVLLAVALPGRAHPKDTPIVVAAVRVLATDVLTRFAAAK